MDEYGISTKPTPQPICCIKARRLGRLIVTSCLQGQGAPLIDKANTIDVEGNRYKSWCIRLPFCKHRPVKSLVIGWRI